MKKKGLLLLGLLVLSGCNGESKLNEAQFELVVNDIALKTPLIIERTTGKPVLSNYARNAETTPLPVPTLEDGNDLTVITAGEFNYEDDDEGVYLYGKYKIDWVYYDQDKEESEYAKYTFEEAKEEGKLIAIPGYEQFEPEYNSANEITNMPPVSTGRLTAIITIGKRYKSFSFDMKLQPVEKIDYVPLAQTRDLPASSLIKVRGYVTGIFPDWNNASISDGKIGFGLFKLIDYKDTFKVGDLIEAVGNYTSYNGLAQIQFIKKVKVIDAENFPDIKEPEYTLVKTDDLIQRLDAGIDDLEAPLLDMDNALVEFDHPFELVEVQDRNGEVVGFEGFDLTGKLHTSVIVKTVTSGGVSFNIELAINYHMGSANQTAIKTFLQENANKPFKFKGHLTAYNKLQLGPYTVDELIAI